MPKKRMHIKAFASKGGIENALDNEGMDVGTSYLMETLYQNSFPFHQRKNFFNTHGNYFDNSKRAQIF